MKVPSIPRNLPEKLLKSTLPDSDKRDEKIFEDVITNSSHSLTNSLRSSLSTFLKSKQRVIDDECSDEESGPCQTQNEEQQKSLESHFEHESGSLNLLFMCMNSQHYQSLATEDNKKKNSEAMKSSNSSFFIDYDRKFKNLIESPHRIEDVKLEDTVQHIINSKESWEGLRKQIRANKLVTSLGVFEACQSFFEDEAFKLKKKRIEEARVADAELTTITRIRRRLSMF